jgi:hypothetical protein
VRLGSHQQARRHRNQLVDIIRARAFKKSSRGTRATLVLYRGYLVADLKVEYSVTPALDLFIKVDNVTASTIEIARGNRL